MKRCYKCWELKPASEFAPAKDHADGLQSSCKACRLKPSPTAEERFWRLVDQSTPTGCWLWMGYKPNKYGKFVSRKKSVYAHRYSYELAFGHAPNNMQVCHSCDNPLCVNPAHLFIGTCKDNMADARNKNRLRKGEEHCKAKLSCEQVISIKKALASGCSQRGLARKYGLTQGAIRGIVLGRSWGWLTLDEE